MAELQKVESGGGWALESARAAPEFSASPYLRVNVLSRVVLRSLLDSSLRLKDPPNMVNFTVGASVSPRSLSPAPPPPMQGSRSSSTAPALTRHMAPQTRSVGSWTSRPSTYRRDLNSRAAPLGRVAARRERGATNRGETRAKRSADTRRLPLLARSSRSPSLLCLHCHGHLYSIRNSACRLVWTLLK